MKPQCLLIYKRSALSVAGRLSGKLRNSVQFKNNHIKHYESLRRVENMLHILGVPYVKKVRNSNPDYGAYNLVITVGGDGTFLEAARNLNNNQLLLGVNSDPDWSVGRFCHANADNFEIAIKKVLDRSARISHLYKLKISLDSGKGPLNIECFNDVLICHSNPAAMSRYKITLGKIVEEHRNSGIWFSSAAGSTGAILSAGGRALPENSRNVQFRARELYHIKGITYQLTGGLVRPGYKAIIVSQMTRGAVFIDGAHVVYPFPYGSKAAISHSPNFINLIYA